MIHVQPAHARLGPREGQTIDVIIDHGHHPQAIVARAGLPLRVVFRRRDTDDCTDRVVFSSPHIDRRPARGSATTIVLPPNLPERFGSPAVWVATAVRSSCVRIALQSSPRSSLPRAVPLAGRLSSLAVATGKQTPRTRWPSPPSVCPRRDQPRRVRKGARTRAQPRQGRYSREAKPVAREHARGAPRSHP